MIYELYFEKPDRQPALVTTCWDIVLPFVAQRYGGGSDIPDLLPPPDPGWLIVEATRSDGLTFPVAWIKRT